MAEEGSGFNVTPFSSEILDEEAAKISELIFAIQQRCSQPDDNAASDLFRWAEECDRQGRRPEAEFLYLHFIQVCERKHGAVYPIAFAGLREYARELLDRTCAISPADSEPALQTIDAPPAVQQEFGAAA